MFCPLHVCHIRWIDMILFPASLSNLVAAARWARQTYA
jgi:hypothetical protein